MRVAPEQQMMDVVPQLQPQPRIPGNGCCCQCCGAGPPPIDVSRIVGDGGKFVQLQDGRIVEYWTYGSEAADAQIFIQVNGSMGSGKLYRDMPPLVKMLEEKNIKGISISLPGHGFSSNHPFRRIVEWARDDVEPVLQAEGVGPDAPLMIEGSSFGAPHAFSLLHHFSARITHAHFLVPNLPWDVSRELSLKEVDEGFKCAPSYPQKCFLIPGHCSSPCVFCCCVCCFDWCSAGDMATGDSKKYDEEIGFPMSKVQAENIKHAKAGSIHGFLYNAMLPRLYSTWGFDPFKDISEEHISTMKILVSYGKDDKSSPEEHGRRLGVYFSEKCNKDGLLYGPGNDQGGRCIVNIREGGHSAHHVPYAKGELHETLFSM